MTTLREQLEDLADAIPGYTTKNQARQTGCSIYFTYDRKIDVMKSLEFCRVVEQAVPKLLACTTVVERVQLAKDDPAHPDHEAAVRMWGDA